MRRLKNIRRRKAIVLNTLLLASALLFYETHTTLFFREFTETQLENMFSEDAKVKIGKIEGGVFRNIMAEDVSITPKEGQEPIVIERIEVAYRFWYPLLRRIPKLSQHFNERKVIVFLGKKEDFLSGFLKISGTSNKLNVSGYIGKDKESRLFVEGLIEKGKPYHFELKKKEGTVFCDIEEKEKGFLITAKINHMKFQSTDYIGEMRATIDTSNKNFILSRIFFEDMIINYEPFNKKVEFVLSYNTEKEMLNITSFRIGNELEGYGHVRLGEPRYMFLKLAINNFKLEDFFKSEKPEERVSGTMNGNFTFKGPISEVGLLAHFDIQEGYLGETKFDSIIGNLIGAGPLVQIHDTRLRKEGGYILIGGYIDFKKWAEGKAFDTVTYGPDKNFFVWEGWSVIREEGQSGVKAEKVLDEDFSVSFKSETDEERMEEKHFLGVERKVKF